VVINRADLGNARVEEFCSSRGIPILMRVPHDMGIARAYSRGELIVESLPGYRDKFQELWGRINAEVGRVEVAE
jgi:MinD superfamily P-loop ATPase